MESTKATCNARIMLMQHVISKSYRRTRSIPPADFMEEQWWKMVEFFALRQSSETAASRWLRAKIRIAKVVKGSCKDQKAQILASKHWLEAIDPRHRYGYNLHLYYVEWLRSQSPQHFFYWLDFGDGREFDHQECPRIALQDQCIQYLGKKEREAYEVSIRCGKLVYTQSGSPVDTNSSSEGEDGDEEDEEGRISCGKSESKSRKWIYVLSTSRNLYVGRKRKGEFQHSSFVAGAAVLTAGRLISSNGILLAIWSYSGHYRPKEENFSEMISFLKTHQVDLSNVKTFPLDDDVPPPPPPFPEG